MVNAKIILPAKHKPVGTNEVSLIVMIVGVIYSGCLTEATSEEGIGQW